MYINWTLSRTWDLAKAGRESRGGVGDIGRA